MPQAKMGGKPVLRLLALGGPELTDVLQSRADGGGKLDHGLRDRVATRYDGRVDVALTRSEGATFATLAERAPLIGNDVDVVLISTHSEVEGAGRLDVERLRADGRRVFEAFKEAGAHILVLNTSTVDPRDHVTNYYGHEDDTPSLRAHKVALALIDLSYEQGVSIIDADRLLAELGAETHVESLGRYSAEASEVVCDEVVRVLADYGFFEERPLVVQAGRGGGR